MWLQLFHGSQSFAKLIIFPGNHKLSDYVQHHCLQSTFGNESWSILSDIERSIKQKVETVGVPLREWDIQIYRGVLTGYNEAFIISTEKREEILAKCQTDDERQRTAEIIRPILRGRDIKRYGYEFADQYIIATFPSKQYNIDDYQALREFLLTFGMERLEQTGKEYIVNGVKVKARKKTNNKWFETQDSISYVDLLAQPKIVWGEISDRSKFSIDFEGRFFPEATTFMMTGHDLWLLQAFLNSSVSEYIFSLIGTTTGVGTVRWKKYKILELPVPKELPDEVHDMIVSLSQRLSKGGSMNDSQTMKRELDNLIYLVYDLDEREIEEIESHIS